MGPLATSHHMTVEITGGPQCGYVCLAGEVDLAGQTDLTDALRRLAVLRCRTVSIDLGGVTFAGSELLNFLARVAKTMPVNTPMVFCRPTAMTRRLIQAVGLDTLGVFS